MESCLEVGEQPDRVAIREVRPIASGGDVSGSMTASSVNGTIAGPDGTINAVTVNNVGVTGGTIIAHSSVGNIMGSNDGGEINIAAGLTSGSADGVSGDEGAVLLSAPTSITVGGSFMVSGYDATVIDDYGSSISVSANMSLTGSPAAYLYTRYNSQLSVGGALMFSGVDAVNVLGGIVSVGGDVQLGTGPGDSDNVLITDIPDPATNATDKGSFSWGGELMVGGQGSASISVGSGTQYQNGGTLAAMGNTGAFMEIGGNGGVAVNGSGSELDTPYLLLDGGDLYIANAGYANIGGAAARGSNQMQISASGTVQGDGLIDSAV